MKGKYFEYTVTQLFMKRTGDRSLSRKIINRSSLIHNRKQCHDKDAYNQARESIMS